MQKLLKGRPMELARTAWAMTDTGSDASKFLEEIESSERIQQKIADDASLSDVVNILVAFSKNKPAHIAPNLLSKLEEKGVKARRNNSSGPISYFDKMVLRATPKEVRAFAIRSETTELLHYCSAAASRRNERTSPLVFLTPSTARRRSLTPVGPLRMLGRTFLRSPSA